jgi:hypothetical protein
LRPAEAPQWSARIPIFAQSREARYPLARIRRLIREADREVVEDVKWRKPSNPGGVPVREHVGLVCTGEDRGLPCLRR